MLNTVKAQLFTLSGLVVTVIHTFIIVGALASWVWIRVDVLGEDVMIGKKVAEGRLR